MGFYVSFGTVLLLLAVTAPVSLSFGFFGAMAARARFAPLSWLGKGYIAIVRGVPDIAFFLFFVIALDQGIEYLLHSVRCPDWTDPIRQGNDFVVCDSRQDAALNLARSGFMRSMAFQPCGADLCHRVWRLCRQRSLWRDERRAAGQIETAEAYGMTHRQAFWRILVPQMWVYALPGLSNLWMVLIKATPLLFLLGVEDIVYWARELGGSKTHVSPTIRMATGACGTSCALLIFYLAFTKVSEIVLERITKKLSHGQATVGGEAQRKAA